MRQQVIVVLAVLLMLNALGAETFVLIDSATDKHYGPFTYKDGAVVQVGDSRATIRRVEHKETTSERIAKSVTIPVLSFREAALRDVVTFFREETIPLGSGPDSLNIILKAKNPDSKITMTMRGVSVYDALCYVAEVCDLELRWDENAVVISDRTGIGPTKPSSVPVTRGTSPADAGAAPESPVR